MSSPGVTSCVKSIRTPRRRSGSISAYSSSARLAKRAADPAELLVGLGGHRRVLPTLVELGEGELQQRQRAGAADDLADHGADEARFEAHTGTRSAGPTIASCSSVADIGVTANVASLTTRPRPGCWSGRS